MTEKKPLTSAERYEILKKVKADRAAQAPVASETPTKTKRTAKPKAEKVLSQAEKKRREDQRLEDSKTGTERLAESIAAKSNGLKTHKSVQRNLAAISERKPKPPKLKVRPVAKVKAQEPSKRDPTYDVFLEQMAERDRQQHRLLRQADLIKTRFQRISRLEDVKLAEALRDCYGIYNQVEDGPTPWEFYDLLKSYFRVSMVRLQSNTPDESLILRFVLPSKKSKPISEYATVIRYARESKIAKKDFIDWYTSKTQTKILAEARKGNKGDSNERLNRARQLLLQYFDVMEEWPLGVMEYPKFLAERQVHLPQDLIFVICRAADQFNRDVYFNPDEPTRTRYAMADVRALHFIPPVIDVVHDIINRLARFMVPRLEYYEDAINKKTAKAWADDLSGYLTEQELGSAYKSSDNWADRMQAALEEDQVKFARERAKIKKLRDKARK